MEQSHYKRKTYKKPNYLHPIRLKASLRLWAGLEATHSPIAGAGSSRVFGGTSGADQIRQNSYNSVGKHDTIKRPFKKNFLFSEGLSILEKPYIKVQAVYYYYAYF